MGSLNTRIQSAPPELKDSVVRALIRGSALNVGRFEHVYRDEDLAQFVHDHFAEHHVHSPRLLSMYNKLHLFAIVAGMNGYETHLPDGFYEHFSDHVHPLIAFFAGLDDTSFTRARHTVGRLASISLPEIIAETMHSGVAHLDTITAENREKGIYHTPERYPSESILSETASLLPPLLGHFVFNPGTDPSCRPRIGIMAKPGSRSALAPRFQYLLSQLRLAEEVGDKRHQCEVTDVLQKEYAALTQPELRMLEREIKSLQDYLPADPQVSLL
ncbi:hypothetical protein J4464_06940 [Candidatus Woesearchaeota archaeon]|nr:hypothetical protein [Candidatus Woesearchaeota archaeon]